MQRKRKVDIDPQSLIPKLPKPQDLRPFPSMLTLEFLGKHIGQYLLLTAVVPFQAIRIKSEASQSVHVDNGLRQVALFGFVRILFDVCFRSLRAGSDDGTVRVWEVSSGRCFRKWDFKQRAYTKDGLEAAADAEVRFFC